MKEKSEKPIDVFQDNALTLIEQKFDASGGQPVPIEPLEPLLDNQKFLELIFRKKLRFYCPSQPELSEAISDSFLYLAEKRPKMSKPGAGNRNIYKYSVAEAQKFIMEFGPTLDELNESGYKTIVAKVEKLNADGITSPKGKKWHPSSLHRAVRRWEKVKAEAKAKDLPSGPN